MAINASMIWRARPSGDNSNGGGYDPAISSPGTDYSKQDSPHVTFNGTTITATTAGVGATITITGYTVASTDVANVLHITGGTNFTTGWYTIASVNTGAGTWTLDRNCTTGAGAAMTGKMGGGWADYFTNTDVGGNFGTTPPIVEGNIVYILGSGIPVAGSYSTPDYTQTNFFTPKSGNPTTGGNIVFAADPDTPNYDGTVKGGMPLIALSTGMFGYGYGLVIHRLLWLFPMAQSVQDVMRPSSQSVADACVFDLNGYDVSASAGGSLTSALELIGCEIFSSHAKRSTNANAAVYPGLHTGLSKCNVHDNIGDGIVLFGGVSISFIRHCISAKNAGYGIYVNDGVASGTFTEEIVGNTVDGNGSDGIRFGTQAALQTSRCYNNIISNQTGGGKYGMVVAAGTQAQNDRVKQLVDWNIFYNNTANYSGISAGTHDTALSVDPYVDQSTENYKLRKGVLTFANAFPDSPFGQSISGNTAVQTFNVPGAVQPVQDPPAPTYLAGI